MKTLLPFLALLLYAPLALAAVSIEGLISLLVWLIVAGLIFWLIIWLIGYVGLPQPFDKVARVVVGLIAFIILIYLLLGVLGPIPSFHLR